MEAAQSLARSAPLEYARRIDWGVVPAWLLGFGLIVYLGLKGGGYDPLVHDQVGIAVWWIVLAGALVGALPRQPLGIFAWSALGLFAAFTIWTALSLGWTESAEKTAADLARVATYLGVLLLALLARGPDAARRLLGAMGTGIAFVAIVGLLSRLHPAWFPEAVDTARILDAHDRLAYPLNYWNGLAALVAIGLPLLLQIANDVRSVALRALAAAAVPALLLTVYFTISRGGIGASFVAVAVYLAFASNRLPKLLTTLLGAAGGAILIAAASQRDALQEGLLNSLAHQQGDEMLWMTIVVCAGVGLVQAGISLALVHDMRPRWTNVPRQPAIALTAVGVVALLVAAIAIDAPGRVSNAWDDFKRPNSGPGEGHERLGSVAGESRYQFWSATVRQEETKPLTGTGSGTFEFWWSRDGTTGETVHDAHSLYMQTLGELGIVGVVLLGSFLLGILLGGAVLTVRAGPQARSWLAAALAGCVAFCVTAGFDWMWQIPVLPVALLLLASVLLTAGVGGRDEKGKGFPVPLRIGIVAVAIAAIAAIAIPLSSSSLVRQSQTDAREGNVAAALSAAKSAQNAQPDAASPRIQEALLLEAAGDLPAATAAARAATEREETNWRNWLVLSRLEAKQGHAQAAVHAYVEAKSLNPRSPLFNP
ncbi:MAG TPA: O-antigen ligase family protein [Solirubrobacterales bacterium]|nr:O-antigen ligase family protein [Solirubrobacterales bacterium]